MKSLILILVLANGAAGPVDVPPLACLEIAQRVADGEVLTAELDGGRRVGIVAAWCGEAEVMP